MSNTKLIDLHKTTPLPRYCNLFHFTWVSELRNYSVEEFESSSMYSKPLERYTLI